MLSPMAFLRSVRTNSIMFCMDQSCCLRCCSFQLFSYDIVDQSNKYVLFQKLSEIMIMFQFLKMYDNFVQFQIQQMYDKQSPFTAKRSDLKYSPITEKSIQSSHYIQQITSFEPHPLCYVHTNDYISHICLNCNYQCLCGTCLKEGSHKTHNIKNIEKSVKIVDRMLSQYAIRLRSKSDILTLLSESLSAQKTEIYQQFCQYKKLVEEKFAALIQTINLRQEQILEKLKIEQQACFQRIQICSKEISEQTRSSINLIQLITESIEKFQPAALCLFFANRKANIEETLNEDKIRKLKLSMPDVKLVFDSTDFDSILEKVKHLDVSSEPKVFRSISPKRMMKKSVKNLGKTVIRNEKPRDSFPNGTQTPKQNKYVESHKDIIKFFRSPNKHYRRGVSSGKLMSMPASPQKQKQKMSKNPSPSRYEEFKKKTKKNKK